MPYKDKQREKEYKREYMRKYYYRPHVMARIKKYRENPEVKRRRKEHAKEYKQRPQIKQRREEHYQKNKKQILARIKKNYEIPEVKARIKEYQKKYQKKYHKEYDQTITGRLVRQRSKSKRREYSQNVITLWSKEEWRKVLRNSNGFCPGFKRKPHFVGVDKLTLDHVHPLSKAKKDRIYTIKDIQPLCSKCNSTKGSWHKLQ